CTQSEPCAPSCNQSCHSAIGHSAITCLLYFRFHSAILRGASLLMSDSFRTDGLHALDTESTVSDVERDAKIEQLLLTGLDHYFLGQYDDAINVWTRALFLDRSHPRARAYIERARSAQAERQRESE